MYLPLLFCLGVDFEQIFTVEIEILYVKSSMCFMLQLIFKFTTLIRVQYAFSFIILEKFFSFTAVWEGYIRKNFSESSRDKKIETYSRSKCLCMWKVLSSPVLYTNTLNCILFGSTIYISIYCLIEPSLSSYVG